MVVGTFEVQFRIPGSFTLKDKRKVIKSMLAKIKNTYNVSAAETGSNDHANIGVLGGACVSNAKSSVQSQLSHIRRAIESNPSILIFGYREEIL